MFVSYGQQNDSVELQIVNTNAWNAELTYDERNNPITVKFYLDIECVVNPEATSYQRTAVGTFQQTNVLPTITHEVLRKKLLRPCGLMRRSLVRV